MYQPQHFREQRPEAIRALVRDWPFATLVTTVGGEPAVNHLPMEWVGDTLQGHVARGNELATLDGAEVLAIFRGPDAYISPNWYPSKHETGREVPTWNYAVVHVHGRLRTVQDAAWLRAFLERLTDRHEAALPQPWRVDDAPPDHVERMLRGIVGLEIAIERIEAKAKLSQNHPARNRAGVIEGLRRRGGERDAALAALMAAAEGGAS